MSIFIEYYEVKKMEGCVYYFMPIDKHAIHKENYDNLSQRIWRLNTRTNRITEVINKLNDKVIPNQAEFMKIQLSASPVPYCESYLRAERMKEKNARH